MTGLADRWERVHRTAQTWDPPAVPTLVVAPHPDDEVLMAGGLIARLRARRARVTVLAVTDGDAAYPGIVDGPELARHRAGEQVAAVSVLGLRPTGIVRLGIPDGAVAAHEDAVATAIARLARRHALVVAPWEGDHHTDHEACGRAGLRGAALADVPLVQGLFWTWHHRAPADLDGLGLLALRLDARERAARRWAMAAHASQVTDQLAADPVLAAEHLAPLGWPAEHFIDRRPDRRDPR